MVAEILGIKIGLISQKKLTEKLFSVRGVAAT
jgi:hypothetical protein